MMAQLKCCWCLENVWNYYSLIKMLSGISSFSSQHCFWYWRLAEMRLKRLGSLASSTMQWCRSRTVMGHTTLLKFAQNLHTESVLQMYFCGKWANPVRKRFHSMHTAMQNYWIFRGLLIFYISRLNATLKFWITNFGFLNRSRSFCIKIHHYANFVEWNRRHMPLRFCITGLVRLVYKQQ